MWTARVLLATATFTLLGAMVGAKPTDARDVRVLDLAEVLNKTMCPIRVEIDENEDRVPRRIKTMKCEQQPAHWCRSRNLPAHECCHHRHERHTMECVEMRDTVLVYYKSSQRTEPLEVSVGCSCVIEQTTQASRLPGPT